MNDGYYTFGCDVGCVNSFTLPKSSPVASNVWSLLRLTVLISVPSPFSGQIPTVSNDNVQLCEAHWMSRMATVDVIWRQSPAFPAIRKWCGQKLVNWVIFVWFDISFWTTHNRGLHSRQNYSVCIGCRLTNPRVLCSSNGPASNTKINVMENERLPSLVELLYQMERDDNYRTFSNFGKSFWSIADLIHIDGVVSGSSHQHLTIRREFHYLNGLLSIHVLGNQFPRHRIEHQPFTGYTANGNHVAIIRETARLHLFADVFAPHHRMWQWIPQLQQTITSAGDKLRHIWMNSKAP